MWSAATIARIFTIAAIFCHHYERYYIFDLYDRCDVCDPQNPCDICHRHDRYDICDRYDHQDICDRYNRYDICDGYDRYDIFGCYDRRDIYERSSASNDQRWTVWFIFAETVAILLITWTSLINYYAYE